MRRADYRAACKACREQVSLELDGELSDLERILLEAHLERCPACRAYADAVGRVARLLRTAPMERADISVIRVRARRALLTRIQATAAAALAFAAVGLGSQLVALNPSDRGAVESFRYPTRFELDQEQALLADAVTNARPSVAGTDTVR